MHSSSYVGVATCVDGINLLGLPPNLQVTEILGRIFSVLTVSSLFHCQNLHGSYLLLHINRKKHRVPFAMNHEQLFSCLFDAFIELRRSSYMCRWHQPAGLAPQPPGDGDSWPHLFSANSEFTSLFVCFTFNLVFRLQVHLEHVQNTCLRTSATLGVVLQQCTPVQSGSDLQAVLGKYRLQKRQESLEFRLENKRLSDVSDYSWKYVPKEAAIDEPSRPHFLPRALVFLKILHIRSRI